MITTDYINNCIKHNEKAFIEESNNSARNELIKTAKKICDTTNITPLILISGPSGSGKTTTAIKLSKVINDLGYNTCYVSMDKYFKNFTEEEKELKRLGKLDLESPSRVDSDFLNCELQKLLDGKDIEIPAYDFLTNSRKHTGKFINRNNGFVIVEGIHALNPDVLGDDDDISSRIYVSVRTRIADSDGNKMHPCKIRLMRRMMRDKLFRGREIEETIKMFPKVQRGENQFIMPYKPRSTYDIDTFIPYEISAYKKFLYDDILEQSKYHKDIKDMLTILNDIDSVNVENIPTDVLVREFIGGSTLKY